MCPETQDEALIAELERAKRGLLGDSNDPTSYSYVRHHVRPQIHWWRILLWCSLAILASFALALLLDFFAVGRTTTLVACVALLLVIPLICLKRVLICMVEIYQRYAPDSLRDKCRFEPSCSTYMILSLQKYGALKGLCKGIDRLRRCNVHNGGFDEP